MSLGSEAAITEQANDLQAQLLQETRQKLFGRNVSTRGSIMSVYDEHWFFPNQLQFSYDLFANSELIARGIEIRRHDMPNFIKEFQTELLYTLFER